MELTIALLALVANVGVLLATTTRTRSTRRRNRP